MKVWISANPRKLSRWERELMNSSNRDAARQMNFFGIDYPDIIKQQERGQEPEKQEAQKEAESSEKEGESLNDK